MSESRLAEKATRLFTFLAKAQQLRQAPVADFESYRRDGAVHWLNELPEAQAVRWGAKPGESWDVGPLVSIDRLIPDEPPTVPDRLAGWILGDAADAASTLTLAQGRWGSRNEGDRLEDHPEVTPAFERWLGTWTAWAERFLRDQPVRDAYAALFKMYVQTTQKSEELELLLGLGLLSWNPDGHDKMRRHLFTVPVIPKLVESDGQLEFFLDEGSVGLHTELDMLDPSLIPDRSLVRTLEERGHGFSGNPLDPEDVGEIARSAALQLHDQGRWDPAAALPDVHDYPVVAWAPALILRPRNRTGLVQAFLDIARQIEESGEVPAGLIPLIDPDRLPPVTEDSAPGAVLTFDDEVVAPLPLNDVQRRILERVDRHAQTLVQGPPGTGKTHTAAALLTHLLAQGKRVLVTAHTDRALREVRTKLPDQIRSLAVSVIGASRDDLADLRTAVDTISRRAGDHDEDLANRTIRDLVDRASTLDQERRRLSRVLVDARAHDVEELDHHGYAGTLAAIAQQYQARAAEFSWAADFVVFTAGSEAPLTDAEATEWLALLRDSSLEKHAEQSGRRRLPSQAVLDADTFAGHVRTESQARELVGTFADVSGDDGTESLRALPASQRPELQQRLRGILNLAVELGRVPSGWIGDALDDVRGGADDIWRGRAAALSAGLARVDALLDFLPPGTRVDLPGDPDRLRAMAQSLSGHLQSGGTLKTQADGSVKIGMFAPGVVKDCRLLLETSRVNGLPPATAEALAAITAYRDAWNLLDELDRAWPGSVEIPDEDTPRERAEWHRSQLGHLDKVLELGRLIRVEDDFLRQTGVVPPSWRHADSIERLARSVDALAASEALASAAEPLGELDGQVYSVARWADAAEAVASLSAAVRARDHEAYALALKRLQRLEEVAEAISRRDTLTERVRSSHPELAGAVEATRDDEAWDSRLAHLGDAFRWGSVGAWVLSQKQVDANTVQAQITVTDQQLRDTAENIAAQRAWNHAVGNDRLTPGRRADLRNYSQQVSRLGKGTGKYAAQQRAEIRQAMERCRPAVPVWIMPIYRVAEQFRMEENMFDVVVVDEASQAGLEATFLQYLAPKIVVIGDDKQVSPAAVGVDQQQLRDLVGQYLHDDRYKDTWKDPQRSLFDEAAMRYGGQLTLVEHRRCVPEIIGFSNRIAYEPNGIRLVPVRQFGADRLAPFVVRHVPDGAEEGASGKINRNEARALVDDLKECLEDPAFDGASMAVISLVGDRQAKYIESLLLGEISAEEWSRRSLRVGTAPDFQGSERDVVFLSMVSAVEPGRRLGALTRDMYVQRFNVAVSRAKDQVRLFHSAALNELPNSDDLRYQLLDYAYGVVGRTNDAAGGSVVVSEDVRVEPFDSLFEQRIYNRIVDRGFTVTPQVEALGYSIDLVVVGARARLAIECDGDAWHGPDAYEHDLGRQRELERCGWRFFRVRESSFYVDPAAALAPLWDTLEDMGIRPSGWIDEDEVVEAREPDPQTPPVVADEPDDMSHFEEDFAETDPDDDSEEQDAPEGDDDLEFVVRADESGDDLRIEWASPEEEDPAEEIAQAAADLHLALGRGQRNPNNPPRRAVLGGRWDPRAQIDDPPGDSRNSAAALDPYEDYRGWTTPVSDASDREILDGLLEVVAVEGPVRGNRLRTAYVLASGGQRVGKLIAERLNSMMLRAERRGLLVGENPAGSRGADQRTYRLPDQPEYRLREPGPRALDEIPHRELAEVMRMHGGADPSTDAEQVFRDTLHVYGRSSLTRVAREQLEPGLNLLRSSEG